MCSKQVFTNWMHLGTYLLWCSCGSGNDDEAFKDGHDASRQTPFSPTVKPLFGQDGFDGLNGVSGV